MKDGFDVESWTTIEGTPFSVVADDWLCTTGLPIVHLRWWGSYIGWMEDEPGPVPPPPQRPIAFLISWYEYNPGPPYSMPGELIISEYCIKFSEEYYGAVPKWDDPSGMLWEHEYVYDQKLPVPFRQKRGKKYFISIQAIFDSEPEFHWGWKNSETHWNDDAVYLNDDLTTWTELIWPRGHRLGGQSMDMAFELWSIKPIIIWTFETDPEDWLFLGRIPPFDEPTSTSTGGHLGLNPNGSLNSFSYWFSPDIRIQDSYITATLTANSEKPALKLPVDDLDLYRASWQVGSSSTDADRTVSFRLRVNQKGSWQSWNRVITSLNQQAPSLGNPKWYDLYFNPMVTGQGDDLLVFAFDVLSFDPTDDQNSWIYLEELMIDKVELTSESQVLNYDFTTGSEGWTFAGKIPTFDEPTTTSAGGHLGLNPDGSLNCFSYWFSPDESIENAQTYRALFTVSSSVTNTDDAVQFRLRVNQKSSWQEWERVVNSYNLQAPSTSEWKTYDVIFEPNVTGLTDENAVFSFDIMSFDPYDDENSWLYLESMSLEKVSISP